MKSYGGLLKRYGITKVTLIVPGGDTGHDSIYLGLEAMKKTACENDIVLIHGGVCPLINEELILKMQKSTAMQLQQSRYGKMYFYGVYCSTTVLK